MRKRGSEGGLERWGLGVGSERKKKEQGRWKGGENESEKLSGAGAGGGGVQCKSRKPNEKPGNSFCSSLGEKKCKLQMRSH